MMGLLSFLAWAVFIIGYIGFSADHKADKDAPLTAKDVIAFPGVLMGLMLPFALVGGFIYLLARPFM